MGILRAATGYIRREWQTVLRGRPLTASREYTYPPCFIVGSGRCGSTLLRAILMTNPQINIPPETYVLGGIIDEYRLFNRLPWSFVVRQVLSRLEYQVHFDVFQIQLRDLYNQLVKLPSKERSLSMILDSVYRFHASYEKPGAIRWGDKTPGNALILNSLVKVFPDMQVVHMIRDGRDVVRSYIEMDGGLGMEQAANRWITSIRSVQQFGRCNNEQHLEIRYENLVRKPSLEIRRLCGFLHMNYTDTMMRHTEVASGAPDIRSYAHYRNVLRPISESSIGKWKDAFDPRTLDSLNRRIKPLLLELGY